MERFRFTKAGRRNSPHRSKGLSEGGPRMLSHQEVRGFYDRFGSKQDWQRFYEDIATEALFENAELSKAEAVVEFGCGTGRFAEKLLEKHLPLKAEYIGVDISETMVALARKRLHRFGPRAQVLRSDGSLHLPFEPGTFDRFVANYVLDLLTLDDDRTLLQEAWRVLTESGIIGLVSLTHGFTPASRVVERIWSAVHAVRPMLVGGCRPTSLLKIVMEPDWRLRYHGRFTRLGVPSETVVAEKSVVL
jgi:ubiquinone/menaquinone biosynthesis C-methylase UbiE